MGKHKTANKGGMGLQKGATPFPSLQDGEESITVQDSMEEIVSMEEVISHSNASKSPFQFRPTS